MDIFGLKLIGRIPVNLQARLRMLVSRIANLGL